jgi:hypothetical protein
MSAIPNGLFGVIARKNVAGGGVPTFAGSRDLYWAAENIASITLTLDAAVPLGSVLAIVARGVSTTSITDDSSNTWAAAIEGTLTGTGHNIWWAPVTTALALSDTITINFSSGFAGRYAEVVEIANASLVDDTGETRGFTTTAAPSLTTTADAAVVGLMDRAAGSGGAISGSNSTLLTFTTQDIQTFYKDLTGAQTISVGTSTASATTQKVITASFK